MRKVEKFRGSPVFILLSRSMASAGALGYGGGKKNILCSGYKEILMSLYCDTQTKAKQSKIKPTCTILGSSICYVRLK